MYMRYMNNIIPCARHIYVHVAINCSKTYRKTNRCDFRLIAQSQREPTTRGLIQSWVSQSLKKEWMDNTSAEEKWNLMNTDLCDSPKSKLVGKPEGVLTGSEGEHALELLYKMRNQPRRA